MTKPKDTKWVDTARLFHDTYEKLAPKFGYKTRDDTKEFNPKSKNGKLMIEVCKTILTQTQQDTIQDTVQNTLEWCLNREKINFRFYEFVYLQTGKYLKCLICGTKCYGKTGFNIHFSKKHKKIKKVWDVYLKEQCQTIKKKMGGGNVK